MEIVRRIYESVTGNTELVRENFDPDFEVDASGSSAESGVVRGFDAAEAALREYWTTFEDFHVEIEEIVHADDGLVVNVIRDSGRVKGSRAEVSNRYFHVWTFSRGRIVRLSSHTDRHEALEAAGLSE